ncbi:EAL domain-containing protein [Metabacillus fastidiosus]|uniref:sensor domain-containing protein n=1 Tax=Metabacillus fastidiosus TaxID=1458 RepID=UPI003D2DDB80
MKDLVEEIKKLGGNMEETIDFVYWKDGDGNWIEVNESTEKIFELNGVNYDGKTASDIAHYVPNFKEFFNTCSITDEQTWKNEKVTRFEEHFTEQNGNKRIFAVTKVPFYNQDGSRKALLIIGKDITKVTQNEAILEKTIKELADFKFALDQSSIVAITNNKGEITNVNDKFCEISKYSKEELIGEDHRILNSGHHPKSFFKNMWKTIGSGKVWIGEVKNRAKDGSFYWVKTTIIPFVNSNNIPYQYIAIRQDITEQKEIAEQILYNAYHDNLTGLRNRHGFREDISDWIEENRETGKMAVFFLDLNRFKYINDTLGHNVGDQILKAVSNRLYNHLNEKADLYRFGGDEFIIVVKNHSVEEVEQFAKDIMSLFLDPFYIGKERHYLTSSFGVSLFPRDGQDFDTLIKKADTAMYLAKEKGHNAVQFYTVEMSENMKKTMKLEKALRQAIDQEQFILYYQPQIDVKTQKMIGVEALIRWEHPTLGMVPPNEFIPLAEETGLITPITEWVLRTACRQSCKWQEEGIKPLRMGVNISPYLFKANLVNMVKQILDDTGLDPSYLELEITESIMQAAEITTPILNQLKSLGVRLSIDDFGTGYSSLAFLRYFPIESLKIDRSFIDEIEKDNGVIVKTIIDMATHLNLNVVAEGIETKEQLDFLSELDCDEGQGYLFSRPLPISQMDELLHKMN